MCMAHNFIKRSARQQLERQRDSSFKNLFRYKKKVCAVLSKLLEGVELIDYVTTGAKWTTLCMLFIVALFVYSAIYSDHAVH